MSLRTADIARCMVMVELLVKYFEHSRLTTEFLNKAKSIGDAKMPRDEMLRYMNTVDYREAYHIAFLAMLDWFKKDDNRQEELDSVAIELARQGCLSNELSAFKYVCANGGTLDSEKLYEENMEAKIAAYVAKSAKPS